MRYEFPIPELFLDYSSILPSAYLALFLGFMDWDLLLPSSLFLIWVARTGYGRRHAHPGDDLHYAIAGKKCKDVG